MKQTAWVMVAAFLLGAIPAASAAEFSFLAVRSLTDMRAYLTGNFPLGTPLAKASTTFEGAGAQHYRHPDQNGVEKWVYDINLCSLYVWRWNISANFDAAGKLTQVYLNGEPVHAAGDAKLDAGKMPPIAGAKQAIYKAARPRPEASRGESSLAFVLYDRDTGKDRESDLFIIGGGPSNADPADMGRLVTYNAEAWRSIFDQEKAKSVVNYPGRCP